MTLNRLSIKVLHRKHTLLDYRTKCWEIQSVTVSSDVALCCVQIHMSHKIPPASVTCTITCAGFCKAAHWDAPSLSYMSASRQLLPQVPVQRPCQCWHLRQELPRSACVTQTRSAHQGLNCCKYLLRKCSCQSSTTSCDISAHDQ